MKAFIYSCICLWFLAACSNQNKQETESTSQKDSTISPITETVRLTSQQLKSVGIEVGNPESGSVSGKLTLQGAVEVPPQNIISLSFPMGGYLKSTAMLPGTHVSKGQVLAIMEDMQFIQLQQDYLTAKTDFELAEKEFIRQRELNSSKASSDKVFQQANAQMERQRILMNALGEKLKLIGININNLNASNISKSVAVLSPINGFVSKVNVTVGKYTAPTDVLFELVDPRDIHLVLNVFEKDLASVAVGEQVAAYSNSEPDRRFDAEVILINKTLDANRMAEVHCHFKKYDTSLVPGMFMNAEVSIKDMPALTVPEDAVVRWENKHYVFVAQNTGEFRMVEVKPGMLNDKHRQIESNEITSASKVVLKNAYTLLMKIKNTEEEEG
ncbi:MULTISPECIES: efflux RND transporter periplasmic adaptor subunit [Olivibacter]|jgi:cobalt-zinc-cadmium efflux system membrane fusion protein|uniref:Efflux RND transporter periplasmic adaptor subunit n=2 Tax=Olivibacter TaxID=376469 RepID=A0ABV6HFR3_9SPHI|nr:efflux RND transporter periplasmic adaptor subunit [Olivibacter sp. UJ_SKK_5.1]MDX3916272.1 efflux RND transporter periplasmic adaptor subunit [Pseudosphingobacterium sp.]